MVVPERSWLLRYDRRACWVSWPGSVQAIQSDGISARWLPPHGLKGPCFVAGGGAGGRATRGARSASVGRGAGGAQEAGGGVGREHAGALPAAQAGAVRDVRRGRVAGRRGADTLGLHVHAEEPKILSRCCPACAARLRRRPPWCGYPIFNEGFMCMQKALIPREVLSWTPGAGAFPAAVVRPGSGPRTCRGCQMQRGAVNAVSMCGRVDAPPAAQAGAGRHMRRMRGACSRSCCLSHGHHRHACNPHASNCACCELDPQSPTLTRGVHAIVHSTVFVLRVGDGAGGSGEDGACCRGASAGQVSALLPAAQLNQRLM